MSLRHVDTSSYPGQLGTAADQWDTSAADTLHRSRHERNKRVFTDAVTYCLLLLKRSDRMSNEMSRVPSLRAKLLGREMFEKIVSLDVEDESSAIEEDADDVERVDTKDHILMEGDEQLTAGQNLEESNMWKLEVDEEDVDVSSHPIEIAEDTKDEFKRPDVGKNENEEIETEETLPENVVSINLSYDEHCDPPPSSSSSPPPLAFIALDSQNPSDTDDSSDEPYDKTRSQLLVFNLEVKRRVVKLANENPTWSIKTLRKKGSDRVRSFRQLKKWERQIADGGTIRDKHDAVNTWTYARFVQARDNFQHVDDATLRELVNQAALKYFGPDYVYNTDQRWFKKFKQFYEIKGNSTLGYYKKSEKIKKRNGKK